MQSLLLPTTHQLAHSEHAFPPFQYLVYSVHSSITVRDPPRSTCFDPWSASSSDPYLPGSVQAAHSYLAKRQLEVGFSQRSRHHLASLAAEVGPEEAVGHRQSA